MTPKTKAWLKEDARLHAERMALEAGARAYSATLASFAAVIAFGEWFPELLERTSLRELLAWRERLQKERSWQRKPSVILTLIEEEIRERDQPRT